jgi:hypothetical protein
MAAVDGGLTAIGSSAADLAGDYYDPRNRHRRQIGLGLQRSRREAVIGVLRRALAVAALGSLAGPAVARAAGNPPPKTPADAAGGLVLPAARSLPFPPVAVARSVQGRIVVAHELGRGPRWIAVIGGIHGGAERNTSDLARLLFGHFRANPADIPEGIGLSFVLDLNPDGAFAGTRENARGIDLNRNWDFEWQRDTHNAYGIVRGGGGAAPFSEPETAGLRDYLLDRRFAAAIFLHSRGAMVVPQAGEGRGVEFAQAIAAATGYSYVSEWTAYPLSGQAVDFLGAAGIYAADIELSTRRDPEVARNLRGLRAAIDFVRDDPTGEPPTG